MRAGFLNKSELVFILFLICYFHSCLSGLVRRINMKGWTALEILVEQEHKTIPEVKLKNFVFKRQNMELEDYSVDPGEVFWSKVCRVDWDEMRKTNAKINVRKLGELARRTGFPNEGILDKVVTDLSEGSRIGVCDSHRVSSSSTNAPSAIEHGKEDTEALFDWLDEGFVIGPFNKDEIPLRK